MNHFKTLGKFSLIIGFSSFLLVGCANDTKEKPNESHAHTEGINFDKIYQMKDNETLVEIDGRKLTVKEAKEKIFKQGLISVTDQFIDSSLLMNKYKVTDEEVNDEIKKRKIALGDAGESLTFDKEEIRYHLAYTKSIKDLVTYTDDDLKKIYDQYYAGKDARPFEEMKKELEEQALYILGGEKVYKLQQELRKDAKVEFKEDSLQKDYDERVQKHTTAPSQHENEQEKEKEAE